MFINIGALIGQIGMVYCEYYVGFYMSFLLPTIMLCFCPLVMLWGRKRYRRVPPEGSVLGKAFKVFVYANKGRWSLNPRKTYRNLHDGTFWSKVKPSNIAPGDRPKWMTFDDAWVDEVRRGFNACAVFLWYPLFWICYNQINNNLISQAATMRLGGVPNDVLTNLNPFSLIIMIPLLDLFGYPLLRRLKIKVSPIKKITVGYFAGACAMIWAAVIQAYIYRRSDCGNYAGQNLPGTEDRCPNVDISVWAQSGSYILIAFSEIMASITSLEYAHSKAPANMRSMVQSVALFMNAVSSAIGFALVSLAEVGLILFTHVTILNTILTAQCRIPSWFGTIRPLPYWLLLAAHSSISSSVSWTRRKTSSICYRKESSTLLMLTIKWPCGRKQRATRRHLEIHVRTIRDRNHICLH